MQYCIFYMSIFCQIKHSEAESNKSTSVFPGALQSVWCKGHVLSAEEPHQAIWSEWQQETKMHWVWLSLWASALNEETAPCYTQDSRAPVISKECLCYSAFPQLSDRSEQCCPFKPRVEGQSGLVVQKLGRCWGHLQLVPVI